MESSDREPCPSPARVRRCDGGAASRVSDRNVLPLAKLRRRRRATCLSYPRLRRTGSRPTHGCVLQVPDRSNLSVGRASARRTASCMGLVLLRFALGHQCGRLRRILSRSGLLAGDAVLVTVEVSVCAIQRVLELGARSQGVSGMSTWLCLWPVRHISLRSDRPSEDSRYRSYR